jgi:uncharacterized phage infection (PIP) family protein YhgE
MVSDQEAGGGANGGSRPVPDPTVLTTNAVNSAVQIIKELFGSRLDGAEALTNEKFRAVEQFLAKVEEQRVEQKLDTSRAVDAALAAQEKAISKTEASTTEALTQLKATIDTAIQGLNLAIAGLTERVGKIEGVKLGGTESRAGLIAAVGIGVTLILAVLSVIAFAAP